MDGIYSTTFQLPSPVSELFSLPCQEAKPSTSSVTSITPTRHIPAACGDNPFLRAYAQQSAGKAFQEMQLSTIHTATSYDKAEDSQRPVSLKPRNEASGKKREKAHFTQPTYNADNEVVPPAKQTVKSTHITISQPLELPQQDRDKLDDKQSPTNCLTQYRNKKNRLSTDQIKNKKNPDRRNRNINEQQRRQILAELYSNIEHTIRNITPIKNKLSRKSLLMTCIKVLNQITNQNHTLTNIQRRKRAENQTDIGASEKRSIKNNYESDRRHEIRDLLIDLGNAIPGSTCQKRTERIILQDFLSFITLNQELKRPNKQPNVNLTSKEKKPEHPSIKISDHEVKTDSPNKKTDIFDSSQAFKVPISSNNQVISPVNQDTRKAPDDVYSTLNHYRPAWFESVSQLLDHEFQCHNGEQPVTIDEHPWDRLGVTNDNHSPVSPYPYSPEPSPPGQNKQEELHIWLTDLPPPFDNDVYKTQTDTEEALYPADDLPMMQTVPPQDIFQWAPYQQIQDNYFSFASSFPVQHQTRGGLPSENELTPPGCQQHSPEESRSVSDETDGASSSESEATTYCFEQPGYLKGLVTERVSSEWDDRNVTASINARDITDSPPIPCLFLFE